MKFFRKIQLSIVVGLIGFSNAASAEEITIDGSTTVGPVAKAFAEYYMLRNPDVNITVSESGGRRVPFLNSSASYLEIRHSL